MLEKRASNSNTNYFGFEYDFGSFKLQNRLYHYTNVGRRKATIIRVACQTDIKVVVLQSYKPESQKFQSDCDDVCC